MKGYVIASITINDLGRYEEYRKQAPGVIAKFGGRYLVRGSPVDNVEGDLGLDRVVVLEFPSLEQAKKFYHSPEYQDIARDRMASSTSHVAVLEGSVDPTEALRRDSIAAE